jgi:hypothetical protein
MSAPVQAVKKGVAYWRLAGLTYLDQLNVATSALRNVLKEPAKTEAFGKSQFRFRDFAVVNGKELPPGASQAGHRPRRLVSAVAAVASFCPAY